MGGDGEGSENLPRISRKGFKYGQNSTHEYEYFGRTTEEVTTEEKLRREQPVMEESATEKEL